MESSFSLRLGLLLIGAVLIGLVYFFSTRKSRNRRQFPKQGKVGRINSADAITAQQSANEKAEIFSESASQPRIAQAALGNPPENPLEASLEPPLSPAESSEAGLREELPQIDKNPSRRRRKSSRKGKKSISQMEMSFDDELSAADAQSVEEEESDEFITLYVLPTNEYGFVGESIIQALNAVGLKYGEMEIFHHFGAGRLQTNQALFSVANMLEPGTFDLNQIERFRSPGLVFFLQLPAALDGAVSFELFLNTAQRLTEALDGELFATPKTPLDSALIDDMRRIAAKY